jgi:fructokinase
VFIPRDYNWYNRAVPILVWGEVLWDRFPDGDQLGGAPANVAWHLGRAGDRPRLVTRVGDDPDGRRAIEALARAGVDTALVQVDGERATGEVAIELVDGEPRYRLVPGRAWERIELTADVRAALTGAQALVYGTLSQRTPEGLAAWRAAIAAAPPACLRVCDPNLRPGAVDVVAFGEALAVADVVKVNAAELDAARVHLGPGWADPLARLRRGARVVAVTRGAAGSTLYAGGDAVEIAAVAATPGGDNVGCGDAYVAMLVRGVVAGDALAAIGAAAAARAAAVASRRGATPGDL